MPYYRFCWKVPGQPEGTCAGFGQPIANRSIVEAHVKDHESRCGAGTAWLEEIPDGFTTCFVLNDDGDLNIEASSSNILNYAEEHGVSFHQCVRMMEPYFSWNGSSQEEFQINPGQFTMICDRCTGHMLGDHAALIMLKNALGYGTEDINMFLQSTLSSYECRATQMFLYAAENALGCRLGELGVK